MVKVEVKRVCRHSNVGTWTRHEGRSGQTLYIVVLFGLLLERTMEVKKNQEIGREVLIGGGGGGLGSGECSPNLLGLNHRVFLDLGAFQADKNVRFLMN